MAEIIGDDEFPDLFPDLYELQKKYFNNCAMKIYILYLLVYMHFTNFLFEICTR